MRSILGVALGAIAFAVTIFILTAAPGFLSDRASTVPARGLAQEAGQ